MNIKTTEEKYKLWGCLSEENRKFLMGCKPEDIKSITIDSEEADEGIHLYVTINDDIFVYLDWLDVKYAASVFYLKHIEEAFVNFKEILKGKEEFRLEYGEIYNDC